MAGTLKFGRVRDDILYRSCRKDVSTVYHHKVTDACAVQWRRQGFVEDSERWQQRAEAPEVAAAAAPLPPGDERPLPKPPTTFACHCGATELEASAEPLNSYYCHCTSCRKLCGSDFAHNCQFEPDQVWPSMHTEQVASTGSHKPVHMHSCCNVAACCSM